MSGWVHVIAGPMFSGKTQELIRLVTRWTIADKKVVVFRPIIDTRTEKVTSRLGLTYDAIAVADSWDVFVKSKGYDVIAIDEAQFFDKNLYIVVQFLASEGRHVIISGLEKDFLRRPFGPMAALLIEADEVNKLTAICTICKKDATLTQRLINGVPAKHDDPLVLVGGIGDDTYEARCRLHHEVAMGAT